MRTSTLFFGLLAVCFTSAAVTKDQFINDLNTLNYALALENFEAALYQAYTDRFPTNTSAGVSATFYTYLQQSRDAEKSHANDISGVIQAAGWIPAPACNFTSTINSLGNDPETWLSTLTTVENVGAQAYTGAVRYLTNNVFLQYAATVATVEARHASFLNTLTKANNGSPFPETIQSGKTVDQVFAAVASFFTDCPTSAPKVCFDGVTRNFSVLDHAPGKPYSPKNATSFRTPSGTYAVGGNGPSISQSAYAQDTLVLQYALTAENLEDAFYKYALANVSRESFITYYDPINPLNGIYTSGEIYDLLSVIAGHEAAHVQDLNSAISARGTSGVPKCTYAGNFTGAGFDGTPAGLLSAARTFENAGVGAYVGAITLLTDMELVSTAAGIALVEARHAAYLQLLTGQAGLLPGSNQNNDSPSFANDVATLIGGLLGDCPNITVPDALNGGSYSSKTLPFSKLQGVAADKNKAGGYNDAAPYATATSSSSSGSTGTTPSTSTRASSGSTIFVSVALIASVAALLL